MKVVADGAVVYTASAEREPIAGVRGGAPSGSEGKAAWSGVRGEVPPEAGGILISDAKTRLKLKKINSKNKSQM